MVLYEIYSHSDRYHYRAKLFSLATLFLLICIILTFLMPFLFVYYAGGYWFKEASYSEQARVNYSSKYIVFIDTLDSTSSNRYFSSSYGSLNTYFGTAYIPCTNTYAMIDSNFDGIADQYSIELKLTFGKSLTMNNVHIWLIFPYELRARQYINMETMALINPVPYDGITLSDNPFVTISGNLILEQRQPIQSSGSDTTYNRSILNINDMFAYSSVNLNPILDEYFTRKFYTTYQTKSVRWTPGKTNSEYTLTINVTMNIDRQSIRFIPGFWQEFKWGWIQYVCVLLPFIIIFNEIKQFVFRNKLVQTLVELPSHRYRKKQN